MFDARDPEGDSAEFRKSSIFGELSFEKSRAVKSKY